MRWRTVLAILFSLLLLVPLALLLGGVLRPALPEVGPGGKRISPVLTPEERGRLMTYRRDCGSGQPCEPPLGCVTEGRYGREICTDSQCTTDAQCPEGHVCRTIATVAGVPLVPDAMIVRAQPSCAGPHGGPDTWSGGNVTPARVTVRVPPLAQSLRVKAP